MSSIEHSSPYLATIPTNFIGRRDQIIQFVEHILLPNTSSPRLLAISGDGGVGKTELLGQLRLLAQSSEFEDLYLTASIDEEGQVTPADIMKEFANQFSSSGHRLKKFEQEWRLYKDRTLQQQAKREDTRKALVQEIAKIFGTAIEEFPGPGKILGPPAEVGADFVGSVIVKKYEEHQHEQELEMANDPLAELTRAFIADLMAISRPRKLILHQQAKPKRIVLFFDSFGHLAPVLGPWLLRYLLPNLNGQVSLVMASRAPLEVCIPDGWKLMHPFYDNGTLYSTMLECFTEKETCEYLQTQGITDPAKVRSFWQVTQGLPYYLYLLTVQYAGQNIDAQASVVENLLKRIPQEDKEKDIKRLLALQVALFTPPFNRDDLEALPLLSGRNASVLYNWLISLPFVKHQGGEHYNEQIQTLFCLYLKKISPSEYNAARKALIAHYEQQLHERVGAETYVSEDWLPLVLELIAQSLLLQMPDEEYHCKAIEYTIKVYAITNRPQHKAAIVNVLNNLSQEQPDNPVDQSSRVIAQKLLICIQADLQSKEFIEDNSYLLERARNVQAFPKDVLAAIYLIRGQAYTAMHDYTQGIQDLNKSITLNDKDAREYASRGFAYRLSGEYALAIEDFDHALLLDPGYSWVLDQRALAYKHLGQFNKAIQDLDNYISTHQKSAWALGQRGKIYSMQKNYAQAIADLTQAINIDDNDTWAYGQRGLTSLWMNDLGHALKDYSHCQQRTARENNYGWMSIWIELCQGQDDAKAIQQLENLLAARPPQHIALLCQGIASYLRNDIDQALADLEQAIVLEPKSWSIHFWKGMALAASGKDEQAIEELKQSLAYNLPPVLLAPLYRFERSRPDFYQQYIVPLLKTVSEALTLPSML